MDLKSTIPMGEMVKYAQSTVKNKSSDSFLKPNKESANSIKSHMQYNQDSKISVNR